MDKVVHFEIPVDDWERAEKFYKDNFGWSMNEMKSPDGSQMFYVMMHTAKTDDKGMVQEMGAINGGLYKRKSQDAPRVYIQVESLEESLEKIKASGGTPEGGIGPIPNGRFAIFRDSEGNQIGMIDNKKMDVPAGPM